MKVNKNMKRRTAAAAVSVLALSQVFSAAAQAADGDKAYEKNENVYVRLSSDGGVTGTYVVNSYTLETAGTVTDYGDYSSVENLTDLGKLKVSGDKITFSADKGTFYYQGDMEDAQLPWLIAISYKLDGKAVKPEELAGMSGDLEMIIDTKQNPEADSRYYENYLQQISLTLAGDKAQNIVAEGGAIADAGTDRQITFTGMPGKDGHFTVKARVQDFEMSGISIAAVPFSMAIDIGDTDEMTDQFDKLADAVDQLNEGTKELKSGMEQLNSGGSEMKAGSGQFSAGLNELAGNSGTILTASEQIRTALEMMDTSLAAADFSSLDQLAQLKEACSQFSQALEQLETGVGELSSGYGTAYYAMDAVIAAIPEPISEAELAAVGAACQDAEAQSGYNQLLGQYQAAQTVKETYSQVKAAFDAVDGQLPVIAGGITTVRDGISQLAGGLESMDTGAIGESLDSLKTGVAQLDAGYQEFHGGLAAYTDGVGTLAESYAALDSGLNEYTSGVAGAYEGTAQLAAGTQEFAVNTEDMPEEVKKQIDEMTSQYDTSDFEPLSFTSEKNGEVQAVQFVMSSEGIQIQEAEKKTETEKKEGIIDRIKNLFQ